MQLFSIAMGPKRRFIFLISINKCNNWDAIRNHEFFFVPKEGKM